MFDLNKENCKSNCSFSINNGSESCSFYSQNDFTNKSINNENLYFNKLADEIIRYSYIYNFIFNRNYILAIEEVNYKISDKEIMIFDSNLENYFDKEILKIKNKFVRNEEVYDNNKAIANKEEKFLEYEKLNCIRNMKWDIKKKATFGLSINDALESEIKSKIKFTTFGNIPHCHMMFVKYIIEKLTNEKKTIGEIKSTLITGIETFLRLNNSLSEEMLESSELLTLKDVFNISKNNILMKYKEDIDSTN